jgi:pimeloyl-ACP methyl ester carboxylesterase
MGGMIGLRMLVDSPERVRSAAICGMGWTKDDPATRERFSTSNSESAPENPVHRAVYQGFGDLGITRGQLEAITTPIITIVGDQDGLFQSSVQPLREVRPDVPLVLIEGASHMTAPLKPSFRDAIGSWIAEQSAVSPASEAQATSHR